ncbi:hypothetical protein ACP70R_001581 [Stipagrostis hirtigluma subsp. patula]
MGGGMARSMAVVAGSTTGTARSMAAVVGSTTGPSSPCPFRRKQLCLSTLAAVPKPATPGVERPVARPSSTPHRVKATPRARDARQHQRRRPNFLPGVHLEPQASRFLPCTPAPAISPAKRQGPLPSSPSPSTICLHGNRMQLYGYW